MNLSKYLSLIILLFFMKSKSGTRKDQDSRCKRQENRMKEKKNNNGTYKYLGDKFSSGELRGSECKAVHRPDGKCIRGRNGNMLVEFSGGKAVVVARLLRKVQGGLN